MNKFFNGFVLAGLAVALAGCAACKKSTECDTASATAYVPPAATPVAVAEPVVPAAPVVAEEPAEEPVQKKYPRAVLK